MTTEQTKVIEDYTSLISLLMIKKQLVIEDDYLEDDDYLTQLLEVAFEFIENECNSEIVETVNVYTDNHFSGRSLRIDSARLLEVTSIKVDDEDISYTLMQEHNHFDLLFGDSIDGKLVITYNTGYKAEKIPMILKQAVLIKLTDLYDVERNNASHINNSTIDNLIKRYKINYW